MSDTVVDFADLSARDRYKLLSAVVIPRPVAWVTTTSPAGVVNAAPYSFFNVFGQDPAVVVLGLESRADGSRKDTARNIAQTAEFVVNLVTEEAVDPMVSSAAAYPETIGEPDALGLATTPSHWVAPPRLPAAAVSLECRRRTTLTFSASRELVVGEVLGLVARPGLVDPATCRVDWQGDYPIARLFADRYARLDDMPARTIPVLTSAEAP